MPADGTRAAIYPKAEFRRPVLRQLETKLLKSFDNGKSRDLPTPATLGSGTFEPSRLS